MCNVVVTQRFRAHAGECAAALRACVDATWMSLTDTFTALGPPPPVLGGSPSSSTMKGGAVGPVSSCVHHAARGAGKDEDGARYGRAVRCCAVLCGGGGGG